MPYVFADIPFSPSLKATQQREGRRADHEGSFEGGNELFHSRPDDPKVKFIDAQRSFDMATTYETDWRYLQRRGMPLGFLKVVADPTLAFADCADNRQLIGMCNLAKATESLTLVEYARRVRPKLLGRLAVEDLAPQDALAQTLLDPSYRVRPKRTVPTNFESFHWNCSQHIFVRIDAGDTPRALDQRDAWTAGLEARLTHRAVCIRLNYSAHGRPCA